MRHMRRSSKELYWGRLLGETFFERLNGLVYRAFWLN